MNRLLLVSKFLLLLMHLDNCLAQDRGVADRLLEDLKNDAAPKSNAATETAAPRSWHTVAEEMRRISAQLPKAATANETLAAQTAIIEELTKLLANSSSSSESGSVPGGTKPEGDNPQGGKRGDGPQNPQNDQPKATGKGPAIRAGSAEQKSAGGGEQASSGGTAGLMQRAWGQLPGRIRERLQSGAPEKFHEKYQSATEEYFRKLAEMEQRP